MFGIDKLKTEIIIQNSKLDNIAKGVEFIDDAFHALSTDINNINKEVLRKQEGERFVKLIPLEQCEGNELLESGEFSIASVESQDVLEIRDVTLPSNKVVSKEFVLRKSFALLVRDHNEVIIDWKQKIDIGEANFPIHKKQCEELDQAKNDLDSSYQEILDQKAITADRDALLDFLKDELKENYYYSLVRKYEGVKQQRDSGADEA